MLNKRNEQEIFNDFKSLGYEIDKFKNFGGNDVVELFNYNDDKKILIIINLKEIDCYDTMLGISRNITLNEFKLLIELYSLWGWLL